jgi:hypothetical protein
MYRSTSRFWLTLLCTVALAVVAVTLVADAKPRWEKLGDRYVSRSTDRDEIKVTFKEGRFDAIKLHVLRRPVHFRDVKIHFGNGDVQDVQIRRQIPAGGETRVIQLKGDAPRVIEKVVFWYTSRGRGRVQAEVELWGRHPGPGAS